jgi:hypothetical protein
VVRRRDVRQNEERPLTCLPGQVPIRAPALMGTALMAVDAA